MLINVIYVTISTISISMLLYLYITICYSITKYVIILQKKEKNSWCIK